MTDPGPRLSGRQYLAIGLCLVAVKFAIDRAVATLAFGRGWSPINYWVPGEALALPSIGAGLLAIVASGVALVLTSMEGVGCLVMCLPLAVPVALLGAWVGHEMMRAARDGGGGVGRGHAGHPPCGARARA